MSLQQLERTIQEADKKIITDIINDTALVFDIYKKLHKSMNSGETKEIKRYSSQINQLTTKYGTYDLQYQTVKSELHSLHAQINEYKHVTDNLLQTLNSQIVTNQATYKNLSSLNEDEVKKQQEQFKLLLLELINNTKKTYSMLLGIDQKSQGQLVVGGLKSEVQILTKLNNSLQDVKDSCIKISTIQDGISISNDKIEELVKPLSTFTLTEIAPNLSKLRTYEAWLKHFQLEIAKNTLSEEWEKSAEKESLQYLRQFFGPYLINPRNQKLMEQIELVLPLIVTNRGFNSLPKLSLRLKYWKTPKEATNLEPFSYLDNINSPIDIIKEWRITDSLIFIKLVYNVLVICTLNESVDINPSIRTNIIKNVAKSRIEDLIKEKVACHKCLHSLVHHITNIKIIISNIMIHIEPLLYIELSDSQQSNVREIIKSVLPSLTHLLKSTNIFENFDNNAEEFNLVISPDYTLLLNPKLSQTRGHDSALYKKILNEVETTLTNLLDNIPNIFKTLKNLGLNTSTPKSQELLNGVYHSLEVFNQSLKTFDLAILLEYNIFSIITNSLNTRAHV